jgi:hypothetical protein
MSRPPKKKQNRGWKLKEWRKTTNEGQIVLLGKNIEEEDKEEDEYLRMELL